MASPIRYWTDDVRRKFAADKKTTIANVLHIIPTGAITDVAQKYVMKQIRLINSWSAGSCTITSVSLICVSAVETSVISFAVIPSLDELRNSILALLCRYLSRTNNSASQHILPENIFNFSRPTSCYETVKITRK
jgi:hypothetical protein